MLATVKQLHRELDCDSDVTASESVKDSDVINGADDSRCFPELRGAQSIMYELRDDIPGLSFVRDEKRVMKNDGEELSVHNLSRCKKIYFESEDGPMFSIQRGRLRFPTPISKRTHSCSATNKLE